MAPTGMSLVELLRSPSSETVSFVLAGYRVDCLGCRLELPRAIPAAEIISAQFATVPPPELVPHPPIVLSATASRSLLGIDRRR